MIETHSKTVTLLSVPALFNHTCDHLHSIPSFRTLCPPLCNVKGRRRIEKRSWEGIETYAPTQKCGRPFIHKVSFNLSHQTTLEGDGVVLTLQIRQESPEKLRILADVTNQQQIQALSSLVWPQGPGCIHCPRHDSWECRASLASEWSQVTHLPSSPCLTRALLSLGSLGLAATGQPWVDWAGGQKGERRGQDEGTGVEGESGVPAGGVCRRQGQEEAASQ